MAGEETTRFGGIDPVTWAHSRGYFLEALDAEVMRARVTTAASRSSSSTSTTLASSTRPTATLWAIGFCAPWR